MLFIKKTSIFFLLSILILCGLISCNKDSSAEEQIPEEIMVEDFANMEKDPKFREHIKNIAITISHINDYSKVLQLLEESELNNMQQIELAVALGFENVVQMNAVYDQLNEEWEQLTQRFDLINQDVLIIGRLMHQTLMEIRYNRTNTAGILRKDYTNEEVHCFFEVCDPPRQAILKPYTREVDRCDETYGSLGEGRPAFIICHRKARQRFSALLRQSEINWVCCIYNDCDLGDDPYPTVEGATPFDYSQCPNIPIS